MMSSRNTSKIRNDINWLLEDNRSWIKRQATQVLKKGPIPGHIGFIVDGNRTYAKTAGIEIRDGHRAGLESVIHVLLWTRKFGVQEVTLYMFSIENYKRSKSQVNDLMKLCRESYLALLNQVEELNKNGIRVRVLGDFSMMPTNIRCNLAKVQSLTRNNVGFTLNIAFVYTGRNEITRTSINLINGLKSGQLIRSDLNVALMDEALKLVSNQLPVDMIFRSSGTCRLSDFMIWQSTFAYLHFTPTLFPMITFWDIWKSIFYYQYNIIPDNIGSGRDNKGMRAEIKDLLSIERSKKFLEDLKKNYWDSIEVEANKIL